MALDPHYTRDETGGFILHFDDETFGPYESIGIVYDVTDSVICLLKHGDFKRTRAWFEKTKKSYEEAGFFDIAADLRCIEVCNCDLNDLNHFLNTSALPVKWIEKLQPIEARP